MLPAAVQKSRAELRPKLLGPHYRGWVHFAFTSLGSLAVIAFALSRLHGVRPAEWLALPASFLVANAAEYFGHRGPMHRRKRGLGLVFQRHTLEHHRFFTQDAMGFESSRDFKFVLFPPVMLLFFLGGIATPIGALCFRLFSANVGWMFVAVSLGYFLTYEWLHFAYHLPDGHPARKLPGVERLRRHHTAHHDPRLMGRYHFNITFPLCDWAFGTMAPLSAPDERSLGPASPDRP